MSLYDVPTRPRQPAWYWWCAVLLAGFFTISSLYISAHRLFWFDEILTALISRMPSLHTMWNALSQSAEQTPPLYFVIVRAFDAMFPGSGIGLRAG